MRLRTWSFCLQEASRNMLRNPVVAFASITTTAVSLLVLGTFLLLSMNISHITSSVENGVAVRAFFAHSASASAEQQVIATVRGWGDVRSVTLITKQEALTELRREFGPQGRALSTLSSANPLEDSVSVTAQRPTQVARLARELQGQPGIVDVSYQSQVVSRLFAFIDAIRAAGLVLGLVLLVGALLVIHNAIRIGVLARRREIAIMRLVGATEALVHWPFIMEGLLLGVLGALIAAAVIFFGYPAVYTVATHTMPFLPMLPPNPLSGNLAGLIVALGALLGMVGFRLSVRRIARI